MMLRIVLVLLSSLVALPLFGQDGYTQKWALVVGIAGYPEFPEGERLAYAGRDASEFAAFIETPEGGAFVPQNVHLITNSNAVRRRLFDEFEWLYNSVGPNDLVYVFFAGHGIEHRGVSYFLPFDASKERPEILGIPMSDFFRKVTTDLAAKQVVLFIDACHAAAASDGSARGPRQVDAVKQWDMLNQREGQVTMAFFSSLANERSWEDAELKHGLFSYFILKGLKGDAPKTPDGWIRADSLWAYVHDQVVNRSRSRFPEVQTPFASPRFRTSFILGYRSPDSPQAAALITKQPEQIAATNTQVGGSAVPSKAPVITRPTENVEAIKAQRSKALQMNAIIERYNDALRNKQFDIAETELQQLIGLEPNKYDYYSGLGNVQMNLNRYAEAAQSFAKGIQLAEKMDDPTKDPIKIKTDLGQMLVSLGNAYLKLKNYKDAIDAYQKASAIDPNPATAYFNLCATLYNTGNVDWAGPACDKAIATNPTKADAYFIKGSLLMAASKMDSKGNLIPPVGTADALNKYLELAPQGPHAGDAKAMLAFINEVRKK
jgi:uncharacterized caspase-like protein